MKKATIMTCYTVGIRCQLDAVENKKTGRLDISGSHKVDDRLMQQTAGCCLGALKTCVSVILSEWESLQARPKKEWRHAVDELIHTTSLNTAAYPGFDRDFPGMPSYTRRMVIADALGMVKS